MATEAQLRANARYKEKAYDRLYVYLRKDEDPTKADLEAAAAAAGESVQRYVINAILERMEKGYGIAKEL